MFEQDFFNDALFIMHSWDIWTRALTFQNFKRSFKCRLLAWMFKSHDPKLTCHSNDIFYEYDSSEEEMS